AVLAAPASQLDGDADAVRCRPSVPASPGPERHAPGGAYRMASQNLPALLMRWRDAEAQWGRTPIHDDAAGALRRAVIDAWQEYNTAAGTFGENEIVLLADDTSTCVAWCGPAERILGWTTESLVGRPISSVTPPDSIELMAASW